MPTTGSHREGVKPTLILWGDPVTDSADNVGSLGFDAVYSEEHERTSTVTEHSVEQGSNVADHVRPNPRKLMLEVFISNTPVHSADGHVQAVTLLVPQPGDGSFLAGGTSALLDKGLQALGLQKGYPTSITTQVMVFDGDVDYCQNALDVMTRLADTATLLQVFTPRQTYQNMILESVKMHRDPGTGTSARYDLEFREIRLVSSKIVDAPLPSILRATPAGDQGKKDTKKADGPKKSFFAHNLDKNGNIFNPL